VDLAGLQKNRHVGRSILLTNYAPWSIVVLIDGAVPETEEKKT
jgi:hypothetical protein